MTTHYVTAHKHDARWNAQCTVLTLRYQDEVHGCVSAAGWTCHRCPAVGTITTGDWADAWSDYLDHEWSAHPQVQP